MNLMKIVFFRGFTFLLGILSITSLIAHQGDHSDSQRIHDLSIYFIENREAAENWLEGFSLDVSGDKIKYHSSDPSVTQALIARASDGNSSIRWKAAPIPADSGNDMLTFVWLAGTGCNVGEFNFDLKIDGKHNFTFSTKNTMEWVVEGKHGSSLRFKAIYRDVHGDLFGYMFLTVPRSQIKNMGNPEIEVTGHNSGSSAWYMTFTHPEAVKDYVRAGTKGFWYRLAYDEKNGEIRLQFPLILAGKKVQLSDLSGHEDQLVLHKTAKYSEAVIKSNIKDLTWPVAILIDGKILDKYQQFSGADDSYEETSDGGVMYRSWHTDVNEQVIQSSKHFFISIPEHKLPWPDHVQELPVIALDNTNKLWMAVIERLKNESSLAVYQIDNNTTRKKICMLQPENMTGIAAPAITAFEDGCFVTFPVEKNDKWFIAYTFVNANNSSDIRIGFINCGGTSNISPSVAVSGKEVFAVWESNAGQARGIYYSRIDKNGYSKPERISSSGYNSYNPDIIGLENGELFAAWDSYRNNTADIWGTEYSNGKWQKELRLTSDPRIERHPQLAVKNNEVWMAWQAQSYGNSAAEHKHPKNISLNHVDEQRIVVAQIQGTQLKSPLGLFEQVSPNDEMLLRSGISFDTNGQLILTARESINQHDGWLGVMWTYTANKWSDKIVLHEHRGRWYPVSAVAISDSIFSVIQFDNQPRSGYESSNMSDDWQSAVRIKVIGINPSETVPLQTEILKMPETDFSLVEKSGLVAAEFPGQETVHNGKTLKLFFGNFHEHTDISVCAREKNPPGHDLFANLRDIEKLDFCALTDHHNSIDRPIWSFNGEQTRNSHDPGRFVTFLGQEWSSSAGPKSFGYGHHNFVFLDPYMDSFISESYTYLTPTQLWDKLKNIEFISIPHQLADWGGLVRAKGKWGNPPKDWNYFDEKYQPVAEVFQSRGSYEYYGCPRQAEEGAPLSRFYLQDAWKRGIIIGVIASPDHGGGYGKIGVWAEKLNRESIFRAVQARHTFGTTGTKMSLLFKSGQNFMGDKVKWYEGDISFQINAKATKDIKEVVIFRNNKIIYRSEPQQKEIELAWIDEEPLEEDFAWYYARFITVDEEIAWSSPIWFIK